MSVQTPKGIIEAHIIDNSLYPGIRISVNGVIVAFIEYDSFKEAIQVCTYDETSDDPRDFYVHTKNDGGDMRER